MDRILIVRRGGLGDTLLLLPMLRAIALRWPEAERHVAGVREFVDVLAHFGAAERAFSSEDLQLWRLATDGLARTRLAGYRRIFGDDPALAVGAATGTEVVVFDPRQHAPDLPLGRSLLQAVGLDGALDEPLVPRGPATAAAPVALAPGSGGRGKCWPRAHWERLAAALVDRRLAVQIVVGPTEQERDDPRGWAWPPSVRFLAGLSAVELAEQLHRCRALVGNDSGPAHLAAALAVPTVVLFGPTDPRVWAPPFPWAVAIPASTPGLEGLAMASVRDRLFAMLAD